VDNPVAASRYLSYVLRHHPEAIGITLDPAGWVDIAALLAALAAHRRPLTRPALDAVVAGTDKRRFEVHGGRIRAYQGHSVDVALGLPAVAPPRILFHGTVARALAGIRATGLVAGRRRHVHLSPDMATATTVGARRGEPVILTIEAAGMHAAGFVFHHADNGVWLTDHVPPQWIVR
jgi:putative RNA 2'-phosphotransferase